MKVSHKAGFQLLYRAMYFKKLYTWIKHQRKVMNAGKMKPERVEMFERLQALVEQYRHVNQYQ